MSEERKEEFGLGAVVVITGTVIGSSRFQDGASTYLVEFERKGRAYRDWFFAEELDADCNEGGGI